MNAKKERELIVKEIIEKVRLIIERTGCSVKDEIKILQSAGEEISYMAFKIEDNKEQAKLGKTIK